MIIESGSNGLEPRILASGWRFNGPEGVAFELEFAAHVGAGWAVAVSSGAVAVELALRSLRLVHGSRVLLSTLAPSGVLQAVARASMRPVLLDVSEETGMPTPDDVRGALRADAVPPRAMLVSHWGGDPCDAGALAEAAGLPGTSIVEDAGQAVGARLNGYAPGAVGITCFSFYTTANLPIGEGGMVTTDDADRAQGFRRHRENGTSSSARRHVRDGHAAPHVLRQGGLHDGLSEQSASIGRDRLIRLDAWQLRRQEIAQQYDDRLADVPRVRLPHRPAPGAGLHGWHRYAIRIEGTSADRDEVVRVLQVAGVAASAPIQPLHRLAYAREVSDRPATDLAGADRFVDYLVCLPIHPGLTEAAVDRVSEVVRTTLAS